MRYLVWILLVMAAVLVFSSWARPEEPGSVIFIVDVSGSVMDEEYRLQKLAYVKLLRDPVVQRYLDGAEIAIIEFGSEPAIIVNFTTDYAGAAHAYQIAPRYNSRTATNPYDAMALAIAMLEKRPGRRIIDIAGDGAQSMATRHLPKDWISEMPRKFDERRIMCNALVFGWNEGAKEVIVTQEFYRRAINGFMMFVDNDGDFFEALKRKLLLEIS